MTVWVGGGGLIVEGRILGVNMVNSYIHSFHWKCVFIRLKKLMYWFSGEIVQNIRRKVCQDMQRGITQFLYLIKIE